MVGARSACNIQRICKGRKGASIITELIFKGRQRQFSGNARSFREEQDKRPTGDLVCFKPVRPIIMGKRRTKHYSTEVTQKNMFSHFLTVAISPPKKRGLQS